MLPHREEVGRQNGGEHQELATGEYEKANEARKSIVGESSNGGCDEKRIRVEDGSGFFFFFGGRNNGDGSVEKKNGDILSVARGTFRKYPYQRWEINRKDKDKTDIS
jgi:hypothetical protein